MKEWSLEREQMEREQMAETMRRFRKRMYKRGYRQKQIWVKDDKGPPKDSHLMDRKLFDRLLTGVTAELAKTELSKLLKELLKLAEAKTAAKKK
jgi:hypothetical protein